MNDTVAAPEAAGAAVEVPNEWRVLCVIWPGRPAWSIESGSRAGAEVLAGMLADDGAGVRIQCRVGGDWVDA